MITEDEDRVYPLGEKAGLLVGYIQEVTAEDLEKHPDAGYVTGSRIGRAGLEALYEDRLRGTSGCRIYIEDENGEEKEILAEQPVQNGEDITVTIDGQLQSALYDAYTRSRVGQKLSCGHEPGNRGGAGFGEHSLLRQQ